MQKTGTINQDALDALSLKNVLSRFNRRAFAEFVYKLCACDRSRFEHSGWLPEAGEDVFYAGFLNSYGGSLHNVWIPHFLPEELFSTLDGFHCEDPQLIERLRAVGKLYRSKTGFMGMFEPVQEARQLQNISIVTNIHGYERNAYIDKFLPSYNKVVRQSGVRVPFQLGSYDSFVDLNEAGTREVFLSFLTQHADGLSISLHPEKSSVRTFSFESPMALCQDKKLTPFEPIYIGSKQTNALAEFESLLTPGVPEARIEKFLKAHFQDVFGFEYDRIETQLWLRFPELDVAGKNRRLDVFLRNSIFKDWELFELKRIVRVTGSHRDIPILAAEVSRSIQQTLYYEKLLSNDSVKKLLAKEGIQYAMPSLNLVIGRTPQIEHAHWRWLTKTVGAGVRILTYDNLLDSMRFRLKEREGATKILRSR